MTLQFKNMTERKAEEVSVADNYKSRVAKQSFNSVLINVKNRT